MTEDQYDRYNWPLNWPNHVIIDKVNGGYMVCDTIVGNCSCGEDHKEGEFRLSSGVLYKNNEPVSVSIYGNKRLKLNPYFLKKEVPNHLNKTIYLSGPMTGYYKFNFDAFDSAAKDLRSRGYKVLSPHENDNGSHDKTWNFYMRLDVKSVADSDAVVVLPGWEKSKGANIEVQLGRDLGMDILEYPDLKPIPLKQEPKENIAEEAIRLVHGDRQHDYGHPYDDYKCTTDMFNAWLHKKYPEGIKNLSPEDATIFMVLTKLSREANRPKRDSLVDGIGYLLCYDKILKRTQELENIKREADDF